MWRLPLLARCLPLRQFPGSIKIPVKHLQTILLLHSRKACFLHFLCQTQYAGNGRRDIRPTLLSILQLLHASRSKLI